MPDPVFPTPIGSNRLLQFPWNRKGAARDHVMAFLALAEAEAEGLLRDPAKVACARHTLAWLARLVNMQRDHLP